MELLPILLCTKNFTRTHIHTSEHTSVPQIVGIGPNLQ